MKRSEIKQAQVRAAVRFAAAGIRLTPEEVDRIEVAGFGLDELDMQGLELITYINMIIENLKKIPGQIVCSHFVRI